MVCVLLAFGLLAWLSGCAAHSMWIIHEQVVAKPLTRSTRPPYAGRILLTQAALPMEGQWEEVARIDVGTVTNKRASPSSPTMTNSCRSARLSPPPPSGTARRKIEPLFDKIGGAISSTANEFGSEP